MDTSEQEAINMELAEQRFRERAGFWNPNTKTKQMMYLEWVNKQVNQRQKTLELDGVTNSKDMKSLLRMEKKAFVEEAKRIKDLIEDGK